MCRLHSYASILPCSGLKRRGRVLICLMLLCESRPDQPAQSLGTEETFHISARPMAFLGFGQQGPANSIRPPPPITRSLSPSFSFLLSLSSFSPWCFCLARSHTDLMSGVLSVCLNHFSLPRGDSVSLSLSLALSLTHTHADTWWEEQRMLMCGGQPLGMCTLWI